MNGLRLLLTLALLACAAGTAHAQRLAPSGAEASYSFSDVYRLTVGGVPAPAPAGTFATHAPAPDAAQPMRVATLEPQVAEYVFSIGAVRDPEGWLLVLSGLALAGWVARRRLTQSL